MKERPWFNRLLSTYLPIFYLAVFSLLFASFMTINQMMSRDVSRSSESYARFMQQTLESSLQSIDRLAHGELQNNDDVKSFLYQRYEQDEGAEYLLEYRLSRRFKSLIVNESLIDSIYLYRIADDRIISNSLATSLDAFGDRAFAEKLAEMSSSNAWTGARSYKAYPSQTHAGNVVTLVKTGPLLAKTRGYLIVNVSVPALEKLVQSMNTQNMSFTSVYDVEGRLLVSSQEEPGSKEPIASASSDYLGWDIQHAISGHYHYSLLKSINDGWMPLGAAVIVVLSVIMVVAARRYTLPIDNAMTVLSRYFKIKSKELPDMVNAHPRFMDKAVDHLIELATQFNDVRQENSLFRRKQYFMELIGGGQGGDAADEQDRQPEGFPETLSRIRVAIVEIDKYASFCETYNSRDQYLIKYVIGGALKELAEERGIAVWHEWLDSGRLAVLAKEDEQPNEADGRVYSLCEQLRLWVDSHLDHTVTVGIGGIAEAPPDIPKSREQAEHALSCKAAAGCNKVIAAKSPEEEADQAAFGHLRTIRAIAESFKQRDPAWEERFVQWMEELKRQMYVRRDTVNMLHYMMYHMTQELSGMPSSYIRAWDEAAEEMNMALRQFESLDELKERCLRAMSGSMAAMEKLRSERSSQGIAKQAKEYVEGNYDCPELSLGLLSEQLGLHQSHLSRLFKDEFGENFVDYVTRIRVEKAKSLLQETDHPIQEIAGTVGYLHYYSFNRAFKRLAGVTPSEYRKHAN